MNEHLVCQALHCASRLYSFYRHTNPGTLAKLQRRVLRRLAKASPRAAWRATYRNTKNGNCYSIPGEIILYKSASANKCYYLLPFAQDANQFIRNNFNAASDKEYLCLGARRIIGSYAKRADGWHRWRTLKFWTYRQQYWKLKGAPGVCSISLPMPEHFKSRKAASTFYVLPVKEQP